MKLAKIHIKPEKFRIGNYVMLSSEGCFIEIIGVSRTSVRVTCFSPKFNTFPLNEVQAIPLAREILIEWCGFTSETQTEELKKGDIKIVFNDDSTAIVNIGSINYTINALHELQNIYYAVMGEELWITPKHGYLGLHVYFPITEW